MFKAEKQEEQHKLLRAVVLLHRADLQQLLASKDEVPPEQQEWSPSLDLEDPPELPHIKEEQEELWTSQEREQLRGLEEADRSTRYHLRNEEYKKELCQRHKLLDTVFNPEVQLHRAVFSTDILQLLVSKAEAPPEQQEWRPGLDQEEFTFTPVPVKGEEDNEEKPQSSQLHQRQTEQIKTEADGEDCGGSEPARNFNPDSHLQPATHDETSDSSEPETDNSCDWEETREPQSGLNPLQNNEVPLSNMECNTGKTSFSSSKGARSFGHKGHLQSGIQTAVKPLTLLSEGKHFSCSVCRTIAKNRGEFHRHKLLDAVFNPEVRLHRADLQQLLASKEEVRCEQQEWSPSLDQEDPPELPHIKEEQQQLWTSQEGEQLRGLQEANITKFTFILVPVKSEEHDKETPQSSQLHQSQKKENRDAEHLKTQADGEDCGGSQPAWNFNPDSHLQPDTHDKTSHSSEPETDDSCGWEETREPHSGLCNTGKISVSSSECAANFGNKEKLQEYKENQTGVKKYRCYVCGNRFEDKSTLTKHLAVHTGKNLHTCSYCGKSFTQSGTLNRHMTVHTGDRPFSCSVCGRRFREKGNLRQHMNVHTGEKPFSCSVCGKKFSQYGTLKHHKNIHTEKKPFNCSICGKGFADKSNQKRHTETHKGEKKISCSICDERFVHWEHLKYHLTAHHWDKLCSCSICGKRFGESSQLSQHMTVHTGEKPLSCSICNERFTRKENLRLHLYIHTGEKPFSCNICNRRFTRGTHLKRHMTVHTGEKAFSCSVCGKKFAQKQHVNAHMIVHTGETPFNCSVCGRAFGKKRSMTRHMKIHIKKEPNMQHL